MFEVGRCQAKCRRRGAKRRKHASAVHKEASASKIRTLEQDLVNLAVGITEGKGQDAKRPQICETAQAKEQ